jgi:hypothetical protein
MSTISASTTSTTAYKVTADTTGTLVLQTGATPTTAVTIDASQNVVFTNAFSKVFSISASVASSALTITASSSSLDFRSSTLGSGTITTVSGTPANLVVPSTATLGTVNAVQSRLVVLALNNAGTIELAVVNISGGSVLDETTLITTTAIAAASNSATAYYSTTARTSVAYRVIGYIESTQATAGTWATAPSTIQGSGGQALAAMSSLGYGQTWQNVTGSRAQGTTYYNTTGKPIFVQIEMTMAQGTGSAFSINSVENSFVQLNAGTGAVGNMQHASIVPSGLSYILAAGNSIRQWNELR